MGKLFELLAAEKTLTSAADKLVKESIAKFHKADQYFRGQIKTLRMIEDTPQNKATEAAARDEKQVAINVSETLAYTFDHWAKAEDCIFQKNSTNQRATADLMFRGTIVQPDVPVDELMGLEMRLKDLRGLIDQVPTLDASKDWEPDPNRGAGFLRSKNIDTTTKTEKIMTAVVLYEATEKHPAQVKEASADKVVGSFETRYLSGCATTVGKSEAIKVIDDLIVECRQARNRANTVDTVNVSIGKKITDLISAAMNEKG